MIELIVVFVIGVTSGAIAMYGPAFKRGVIEGKAEERRGASR